MQEMLNAGLWRILYEKGRRVVSYTKAALIRYAIYIQYIESHITFCVDVKLFMTVHI